MAIDHPRLVDRVSGAIRRHRRLALALQLVAVGVLMTFLAYAVRGSWEDAEPRLRAANPVELGAACLVLAAYYLLFVAGWLRILAALGVRISYRVALQAEMVSMLAKYVPGGVWTPAARVLAMRRAGVVDTPVVLASILLEAALSALAGILVFIVSLRWVAGVEADLLPLLLLSVVCIVPLHPRVFRPLSARLLRPFGTSVVPALPLRTMLELLAFYSVTWLVGGTALFFLLRALGAHPGLGTIPFLGGTSAVGAIVAVLSVFAPSGLGVREASMYGLLRAVVNEGVALGATILNRVAITLVEALLLLSAWLAWRLRPKRGASAESPPGLESP